MERSHLFPSGKIVQTSLVTQNNPLKTKRMRKKINPKLFPDYSDKRVVDRQMMELDTHGVSRRDFLRLASASAVASVTALSFGIPGVAIAAPNGKMAHLIMTLRLEYCANADVGARGAAAALGLDITSLDGQLDSERQLNQYEQVVASGVQAVMLHAPGGGSIKRIAQLANQNKVWFDNTWGTLPGLRLSKRGTTTRSMRYPKNSPRTARSLPRSVRLSWQSRGAATLWGHGSGGKFDRPHSVAWTQRRFERLPEG